MTDRLKFTPSYDFAHLKEKRRVWPQATVNDAEQKIIKEIFDPVEKNMEVWLDHLIRYCDNHAEPISELWRRYGGKQGIEVTPSFSYLEDNPEDVDDMTSRIYVLSRNYAHNKNTGPIEFGDRKFGMGIIANDDYEASVAFVHRMYCDQVGIPFGDRILGFGHVMSAVAEHMRRTFWAKWHYKVPRPIEVAQHLLQKNPQKYDGGNPALRLMVKYAATKPQHPSWPMGHGTCYYAAAAECERYYRQPASAELHKMADEGGMLRCDLFLHYPEDAQASFDLVQAFTPDTYKQDAAA